MFFGEYTYKVDEKGRTPLPPKFRREMREGVVLSKGMEKCITAYPVGEWRKLADHLAKAAVGAKLRKLNRAIFGSASSVSFDGQGRIVLPFSLRNYAEISDSIVAVGANNCVELWNEALWQQEKASSEEQASEIIESLGTQS